MAHNIYIEPGSLLNDIYGSDAPIMQTSIHRQGLYKGDLSRHLAIAAMADDARVVEAIYHPSHPFMIGTQYHAELLDAQPANRLLYRRFADEVHAFKESPPIIHPILDGVRFAA